MVIKKVTETPLCVNKSAFQSEVNQNVKSSTVWSPHLSLSVCKRAHFDLSLASVITGLILIGRGAHQGRCSLVCRPVGAPLPLTPFTSCPPGHH